MADQPPVDSTPAAGIPGPSRATDSPDSATLDLPSRWSGAAAVPPAEPRRSRWARLWERVNGTGPAQAEADDWATVPAVDPWADQDTPVWSEMYASDTTLAPTRWDPAGQYSQAASPAAAKAADAAEKAMGDALAAGSKVIEAAKAAAVVAAAKAAEQAAKAGQLAKAGQAAIADQAAKVGQTGSADQAEKPAIPAPGTYPPPAGGTGLPPMRPARQRSWRRPKAVKPQPQNRIPVQPRPAPGRPAPPPWAARPVPPRRPGRIRRFLRRMTLLTVLGLVLCCGGPLAYWQFPAARQFPVSAVLPDSFADLDLRDTAAGRRAADRLAEQLQDAGSAGDAFAGIYADGRGKRVTVFGVTGWRLTPGSDVDAQLERLTNELNLSDVQSFDVGEFGVHERCGVGRLDGNSVVACAWADHGSLATVLLTRRSLEESAELVADLRSAVLTPKF